jgi:hypothetical protein
MRVCAAVGRRGFAVGKFVVVYPKTASLLKLPVSVRSISQARHAIMELLMSTPQRDASGAPSPRHPLSPST